MVHLPKISFFPIFSVCLFRVISRTVGPISTGLLLQITADIRSNISYFFRLALHRGLASAVTTINGVTPQASVNYTHKPSSQITI